MRVGAAAETAEAVDIRFSIASHLAKPQGFNGKRIESRRWRLDAFFSFFAGALPWAGMTDAFGVDAE